MSEFPSFNEYLESKKIDAKAFAKSETELYMSLKEVFDQVHPDSFTAQKLFLINPIRRKYQLKETVEKKAGKPKMARPVIPKPKPKIN